MSAVVCGKRSSAIFADDLLPPSPPSPHSHHHPAKRSRRSPHRRREAHLHHLSSLFPGMDPQLLEGALDASGDDLDSAIKSLNNLRLESTEAILSATGCKSENGLPTAVYPSVEGIVNNGGVSTANEHPAAADSCQTEVLEKSIVERTGADAAQNLQKENMMLKEQLTVVLRENAVLKRAVAIQHERQKEFDERSQEVQSLKQLVVQYQEQLRTLEINNYALTMHLKQAQQNNSIPGHFNPDVF
uniref:CUE domain-containing protein n=1 Tax=Oryza glumipatula TaxID=40148 RepID=A0A0E0ACD9_9ORYZ